MLFGRMKFPPIPSALAFLFKNFPIILGAFLLATRSEAWQMKQAPLMTQWAGLVDTNNPLPEYPRPQMVRSNWLNLNGLWQFQPGATNDPVPTGQTLSSLILVPYPMESAISGVMKYSEFSWYRRTFSVPPAWSGQRIILHLDAVNWQATVYVNGQKVGTHQGGYDPFSYDLTPYLNGATNELIVGVYSPEDNAGEPRGKQTLYPGGIMYTSSSGIWQPAWLEPVDPSGVNCLRIIPDVDNSQLRLTVNTYAAPGVTVMATVSSNGTPVNSASGNPDTELDIPVPHANLWSPENPFLYDLQIIVTHNGATNDSVTSYFGMRKISLKAVNGTPQIYLNNQPYFELGPLDQGFWPDGIYTAPTDAALASDLLQEKALGFNAVRKHIKVERQRWYYWADKLGLLVWQDMPSCNSYTGNPSPPPVDPLDYIAELTALVTNHWNSPCIIMWDVFNEGQGEAGSSDGVGQTNTAYLVQLVKTLDPQRLVNQASGGSYFGVGDVLDSHNYPDPGDPVSATQAPVDGEFGGIAWHVNGHLWNPALAGTGYLLASSVDDIAALYDGYLTEAVNFKAPANGGLNAAIYTQITDVENECNGLMTYDRLLKPDPTRIEISNEKARSGQLTTTTVVPTSQTVPQAWLWTTNTPATNWYAANFNAAGWSTGLGGFGTTDPGVTPDTAWNTPGYIYLRRTFNPGTLTSQQLADLVFTVYHDEDVAIYINGVPAASAAGYSTAYVSLPLTPQGLAAIIPNGTNVLAVSCYQTTGGQFIDVGLSDQTLIANALVAPVDYAGYWPLDATAGVVAADASGNGDNGNVYGAAWNPNGHINGCLSFNGVNDYVQITNLISADFSIAFWVQTSQSGGTGQWYDGAGLVDGDVGGSTNGFGVALIGGNCGFGVGQPDTTIASTTPINDGAWHQCVATRVQATGVMTLYVDGNLQATGAGNTNALTASAFLRFGQLASGAGSFNGNLDEIRIYNRALGANEVTALYNSSALSPAAPANLTVATGNAQVTLSWFESSWASGYTISRSITSGGPYTVVGTATDTTFTDTNVVNATTYYYVVSAVDSFGSGTNSAEVSAKPFILAAWFKADAVTGLANGAPVGTWTDLSGNSNNASETIPGQPYTSAPTRPPTYVANSLNGLPVVHFNAADSNVLAFPNPVQADFTIFCVFRSTQGSGSGTLYYQGAGLVNGDAPGPAADFGTCLFANGTISAGTGNPDVAVDSGAGFNDGNPHLMTFQRTESTGEVDLYVDGNHLGATTGTTSPLTAPGQLDLGAVLSGGGFLTGDIAEVKIYSSALNDGDRIGQEITLSQKWGIPYPPAPAGLTATGGNSQVALAWDNNPAASSYNLKRAGNSAGPYATIASTTTNYFDDATVANGTTYYYVVSAVTSLGESSNSSAARAEPSAPAPVAWFRADALTGLTNHAPVSAWGDSSGNANNATQPARASQPGYVTGAMNGLPVVRFNSTNASYLAFSRPVQNDFTIIVVFQSSQTNQGNGTAFYYGAGLVNGDQPGTQNDFGTALNAGGRLVAGTGNPDTSIDSAGGFNQGTPHILTFKRVAGTGAISVYVDGTLSATGIGGTQALTAPATLDLGAVPSGGGFFNGDIAEVKLFSSALSDLDRTAEENNLACKYGVSGAGFSLATPAGFNGTPANGSVSLTWAGSSGAAGYDLSSATNANGPLLRLAGNLAATSYLDTNATVGQTNYYVLAAVNGCATSASSGVLAVYLPKPAVTLANTGTGTLMLGWPAWAGDWSLYITTNLNPPIIWSRATNATSTNGAEINATVIPGLGDGFFRLQVP